jgi:hypothetical protein
MNRPEGGPQSHRQTEVSTSVQQSAARPRRVITGTELARRQAMNPLWKPARFLLEWKDEAGRLHTAGNYRITRGRPDGTTETVRYLDSPSLRDTYAESFRGERVLRELHGSGSVTVDVYELAVKGNRKRRREAYESFIRTAMHDGFSVRGCEIDLGARVEGSDHVSRVTFLVQSSDRAGSDG